MLEILKAGLFNTVQDLGREGLRHLGITQAGAMDAPSLVLANRLLDNPAGAAALEIVCGPVEIRFERDGWLALTGALFEAKLDGRELWSGWREPFRAGQRLRLNGPSQGMRLYLAIDGGIQVPEVLGARATDLQAGFGGVEGRALQAGDRLPLGPANAALTHRCGVLQLEWNPPVRVLPGPEFEQFDAAARKTFLESGWQVSSQSNRMGCRLQGPHIKRRVSEDLLSHLVLPGVIQVPPSGQPIVLLADAQTTGGYPRIASVIEADLWKFAQARPGQSLHFELTDADGAAAARRAWQLHLTRFEWSAHGR